jgi:hypothetical protein
MPKIAATVLAFLLALPLAAPGAVAASPRPSPAPLFTDVPPTDEAAPAIRDLAARGVVTGVGKGRFQPAAPVTREVLAVLLDRAYGVPPTTTGPVFRDVPATSYYAPYIAAAVGNGLMSGLTATTFGPTAPVTRLDAAETLTLALGLAHVAADLAGAPLPDRDVGAVKGAARGAIKVVGDLGLMVATAGAFQPTAIVSRADMAVILDKALRLPAAAVGREAALAAVTMSIGGGRRVLNVGDRTSFWVVVHDKAGYVIPATVAWYAHKNRMTGATFLAQEVGSDTVVAYVPGTHLSASLTETVQRPTSLAPSSANPGVCLAGAACPVAFTVLAQNGAPDGADSGRTVSLSWTGPVRGTATSTDTGGLARFNLTLPTAGTYTLTATAPGLGTATTTVTALAAAVPLTLSSEPASLAPGSSTRILLTLPALPGRAPLTVSTSGPFSAHLSGTTLTLTATDAGRGTVTVAAVGRAVASVSWSVTAPPLGAVTLAGPRAVQAGSPLTLTASVPGAKDGTAVTFALGLPDGATLDRSASTHGGTATLSYTPTDAGNLTVMARVRGYTPSAPFRVAVSPGPAVALAAAVTPTPFVTRGSSAVLRAALVDRYGNPVAAPFQVAITSPNAAVGTLSNTVSSLAGPGAVATYTATAASGSTTVTVSSPDHPSFAPVTLTLTDTGGRTGPLAGIGLWLPYWIWQGTPDATILRDCQRVHATSLYLEVATTADGGFYGGPGLDDLVQKAHAQGIAVFAWVFPELWNPAADTAFTVAAGQYLSPLGAGVDGVAMDIETNLDPAAVTDYARAVRQALPNALLIGVTYPPSYGSYPWAALAPYVDAIEPMDYWHYYERDYTYAQVYAAVLGSIQTIQKADGNPGLPVLPIAQAFDLFSAPYNPTELEEEAAIRATLAAGQMGMSFYQLGTMTADEWQALVDFPFQP